MAVQLILKNSAVQDKEATAAQLATGELALNYYESGPFLQCKDTAGNIWRLGGVVIASTAPSSPSKGAWWLDSDDNHLYFYNGSSWVEVQTGEITASDIVEGTARQLLQTNAAGTATEWTSNIDVPGTLDVTSVATFDNNVVIEGNLTVNSAGRVGIGTSSPARNCEIVGGASGAETILLQLRSNFTADNTSSVLRFGNSTGSDTITGSSEIVGIRGATGSSLKFRTQSGASLSDRLLIDSSGNVGVGTASPAEKLQVGSGGSGAQWLRVFGSTSNIYIGQTNGNIFGFGNGNGQFVYATAAEPFGIGTSGTQPVVFGTNAVERVRIDSSGRLGVGTSSPDTNLEVALSGSSANGLLLSSDNVDTSARLFFQNATAGEGYAILQENGGLDFRSGATAGTSSGTQRVRIDSSGNVGIGVTNPTLKLSVDGDSWFGNGSGVEIGRLFNDGGVLCLRASSNVTGLGLATNSSSTHAVRIDSSGRVGIGTSSPEEPFHVKASGTQRVDLAKFEFDGQQSLWVQGQWGSQDIGGTNGILQYTGGNLGFRTSTSGSADMLLDTSGRLGIGTTSPAALLHVSNSSGAGQILTEDQNGGRGYFIAQTAGELDIYRGSEGTGANKHIRIRANDSSGNIQFQTGGSTERARIDSSGRFLVGLSSETAGVAASFQGSSSSASGPGIVSIKAGTTNPTNGNVLGYLQFRDAASQNGAQIIAACDGNWATGNAATRLVFSTTASGASSPTERLRIDSSGRVGIGTSSVSSNLDVRGSGAVYSNVGSTNAGGAYLFLDGNSNGDASGGDYAQIAHLAGGELQVNNLQSQPITFRTANSERVRIDSSGRLLTGTSSDFSGSTNGLLQATSGGGAELSLGRTSTSALGAGSGLGRIKFYSNSGSIYEPSAEIACLADATQGSGDKPGRLTFSVTADGASSPTERMRIGNIGETELYTDTSFNLRTNRTSEFVAAFNVYKGATSVTNGTLCCQIRADGDLVNTNGNYTSLSDAKLKENIVDANSQWDDIKAVRIRNWNFKKETGYDTHTQIGTIAQELELVSPGLVKDTPDTDKDGNDLGTTTKSVKNSILFMKAVKALQEAMERIEQLEAKVAALEAN